MQLLRANCRTLATIGVACFWLGATGCERKAKPEPGPIVINPKAAEEDLVKPNPAASTVREIRNRRLKISAPPQDAQKLVFAPGRLLQLTDDAVIVRATKDFATIVELKSESLRGAAVLPDGGFVVVASGGVLHLEPQASEFVPLARVPLFPDSRIFPDLQDPKFMWIAGPSARALTRYSLTEDAVGLLLINSTYVLEGFDGGAFGLLRDGAFAYTSDKQLVRFAPRGTRRSFELGTGQKPCRILPARRLDQVWLVAEDGSVRLVSLTGKLPVSVEFALSEPVFAAAIGRDQLTFISVDQSDGAERRFFLSVYDARGKQKMREQLPSQGATADPEWFARIIENKGLTISNYEPLVAVGGPDQLMVWNTDSGTKVFSR